MKIGRWMIFFIGVVCFGGLVACLERPLVEARPDTTNQFVGEIRQSAVDKIDLLFMIDNSASMADKQAILHDAVPVLLGRLIAPLCVDASGAATGVASVGGRCTVGEPEFNPVADIHVAVITSSLGAHGGSLCPAGKGATPNDRAHLLGTVRPASGEGSAPATTSQVIDQSQTWNDSGFLAWDAKQLDQPVPGSKDGKALQSQFQDMVVAAGETGCGLEASLESWYRFLVDPEPPNEISVAGDPAQTVRGSKLVTNADGSTRCDGCDLELLAQRRAFLRPDSLLAIVMLSDENDCSIRDDGIGWYVGGASRIDDAHGRMPRATSACSTNPNDQCCRSCADASPAPAGCLAVADDPVCKAGTFYTSERSDSRNLRCFNQQQRFGVDLLYPTSRYVEALTSPTLTLQSDAKTKVQNPLFAASGTAGVRSKSLVFLAGIVGVPWQDIADDASLAGPGLKYLSVEELAAKGRWPLLLGTPGTPQSAPLPPGDPFMKETPSARGGVNPVTQDPVVPPSSQSPSASPINGHEQNVPEFDDLQYACTFPLTEPKTCAAGQAGCDCAPASPSDDSAVVGANSPLCQPPGGGPASTKQFFAKAYPGTRELQVLKDLGDQAIVASICPKVTISADRNVDPNYGYNPAVVAIVDRLKVDLAEKCLPRAIGADPVSHQVQCKVIEARQSGACACDEEGRGPADPALSAQVQRNLEAAGHCGGAGQQTCASFCQCEILQEQGEALAACRAGQQTHAGFCYIDDPASALVAKCPENDKRLLRFVNGANSDVQTPLKGAIAVIACLGEPI